MRKFLILMLSIHLVIGFSRIALAQNEVDCRITENRAAVVAKAKVVASEHCSGKFKNLVISASSLKLDGSGTASSLISYDCGKPTKRFLGALQTKPDDNCVAIQHQHILAEPMK